MWMAVLGRISAGPVGPAESALMAETKVRNRHLLKRVPPESFRHDCHHLQMNS
jgi:hypothetical protein